MRHRPFVNIVKLIGEKGKNSVAGKKDRNSSRKRTESKTRNFSEQMDYVLNILKVSDNKKYIYWYNPDPDGTMHNTGVASTQTKALITEYEKLIKDFTKKLQQFPENTLLLITADHSQIDTKHLVILDYLEIMDCLSRGLFGPTENEHPAFKDSIGEFNCPCYRECISSS